LGTCSSTLWQGLLLLLLLLLLPLLLLLLLRYTLCGLYLSCQIVPSHCAQMELLGNLVAALVV